MGHSVGLQAVCAQTSSPPRLGSRTARRASPLPMLLLAMFGASAIATAAWTLGKRSGAGQVAAVRAELETLRARLERPRWEGPPPAALPAPAPAPAPAAPRADPPAADDVEETSDSYAPISYTRRDDDRFFEDYFGDLNAALEARGPSAARTAEIRSGAEAVLAEHLLGQLDDVSCSEALCRVVVRGASDETRARFAASFPALMAERLGSSTVHAAAGTDRVVGYFAKIGGALPPPSVQPPFPGLTSQ